MINTIILQGRLVAEPEIKRTGSDVAVCNFIIATDRPHKKENESVTDFFRCVAWRNRAEFLCKYFHKGDLIAVTGSLQNDVFTDKNSNKKKSFYKIVVREVHFCGFRKGSEIIDFKDLSEKVQAEIAKDIEDLPF